LSIAHFDLYKEEAYKIKNVQIGRATSKIVSLADKDGNNLKKKKKKKKKRNYKYNKQFSRKYILNDGCAHSVRVDAKETQLRSDGKNSIYFGKSKIRNGTRKQKFRKVNDRMLTPYYNFKEGFDKYNVNIPRAVIIEGCFETNKITLQRQMIPEKNGVHCEHPTIKNMSTFDGCVRVIFRKLKMPILPLCMIDDMLESQISLDKMPGYRYEVMYKLNKKKDAVYLAHKMAKKRWKALTDGWKRRKEIIPGVYTIGARNKRDYDYEDGEEAVSRAVHMPELHVELTSSPWCDNITNWLKESAKGPIYIGNSFLQFKRMEKDLEKSSFVLEGDWKRFDSTLYVKIITCAVAITRCFFLHNSDYVDRHFLGMYDSLVIKDYYTPGGKIFRLFHGLPSGVKSTSFLGSVINLICLVFCVGDKLSRKFNFIVGGDDFLIACNCVNVDKDNLVARIGRKAEELGMSLKFLDIKDFKAESLDDQPCFYKYCIKDGKPYIPTKAYLERVFMPWNNKYKTDHELFKFLNDVMPSLAYPSIHLMYYYKFYSDIYNLLLKSVTKVKKTPRDVYNSHMYVYKKMISKTGNLPLFNYNKENLPRLSVYDAIQSIKHFRVFDIGCFINSKD
jgi:hypothetical protein